MNNIALPAVVAAFWRAFLRLAKGCTVPAAWGDWTAPDTASRVFRRRQQGFSEAEFALVLFGACLGVAWLAEMLWRWLA